MILLPISDANLKLVPDQIFKQRNKIVTVRIGLDLINDVTIKGEKFADHLKMIIYETVESQGASIDQKWIRMVA